MAVMSFGQMVSDKQEKKYVESKRSKKADDKNIRTSGLTTRD